MPLLPIANDSLVYGSDDAGRTIKDEMDVVRNAMRYAAGELHLAGHMVGDCELFAAGDVEVHEARDQNFYIFDLARCFPPESPEVANLDGDHLPKSDRTIFCRKMRPELLQYLKTRKTNPLSPDAFTGWGRFDADFDTQNLNIHKATATLLSERIPDLASHLDLIPRETIELAILSHHFHKFGVNMRHIAYVANFCTQPYVK